MKPKTHNELRQLVCTQAVQNMQRNSQGWKCEACSHTVMDLSSSSPDEIIRLYKQKGGKLCGIIPANLPIKREPLKAIRNHELASETRIVSGFRAFLLGMVAFVVFLWGFSSQTKGQNPPPPKDLPLPEDAADDTGSVWGKVVDEEGEPMSELFLYLDNEQGNVRITQTDSSGRYILKGIPPGNYFLTLKNMGFLEMASSSLVSKSDTLRLDFQALAAPIEIQTVSIPLFSSSTKIDILAAPIEIQTVSISGSLRDMRVTAGVVVMKKVIKDYPRAKQMETLFLDEAGSSVGDGTHIRKMLGRN